MTAPTSQPPYLLEILDSPHRGQFVRVYDPDAHGGRGHVDFTRNPGEAMHFTTVKAALDTWRVQSTVQPWRGDGQPNRPLTAFTITVTPLADAQTREDPTP